MVSISLKSRVVSAASWGATENLLRQVVTFAVSIVLARLLTPAEFGIVALMSLFIGLIGVLVEGGFTAALIQRQDASHEDESTVFWCTLLASLVGALSIAMLGPALARFYKVPILSQVALALAVNLVLATAGSVHITLMIKRLEFGAPAGIRIVAAVVAGAVAIAMASKGFGVWSLVAQTLVGSGLTSGMLWIKSPWRPRPAISAKSARSLFRFGGFLLASKFLDVGYNRLHTLLIGRLFGVEELGQYSRAESTRELPSGVLSNLLSSLALPLFSAQASESHQLRRLMGQVIRASMFLNVPMMLGIASSAESIVLTLFGRQWMQAVPVLQILCLAGLFWPLHVVNVNVLMALGHGALLFRMEMFKKITGLTAMVVGVLFGLTGLAWSQVAYGFIALFINSRYTGKHFGYGVGAQLFEVLPLSLAAAAMTLVPWWLNGVLSEHVGWRLAAQVGAGVVIYLALCHMFQVAAYKEVRAVVRDRLAQYSIRGRR